MNRKFIYILIVGLAIGFSSFSNFYIEELPEAKLLEKKTEYEAGSIVLKFKASALENPQLFLHYSYGSTLIKAERLNNNDIKFTIPENISTKTGQVDWKLITTKKTILKGTFKITPKNTAYPYLESYFGPTSIQAGDRDYSMLVVVPTDHYDNPLPDNTPIHIKKQFLQSISEREVFTENLMGWKNIYTEKKAGLMAVMSTCFKSSSKELVSQIFPSTATDFTINFNRNHAYADGNQLTEFVTSEIKDEFDNTIADGTTVEFVIKDQNNYYLKTAAATINGVAKAKMLHPDHPETWKVKAYIIGMAESDVITVNYQSILADFELKFIENKEILKVGLLKSYMGQVIPDGARVNLSIYHEGNYIESKKSTSNHGEVIFNLPSNFYPEKEYLLEVSTLGLTKSIEIKKQ
ncbi:hypothetical protein [Mesonia aestuariivivens]|uniref:Uncharacterized protein n=1 Tax=Mesonia aestuariivivens TaxID=2796128 RepID=A0ABS6W4P9_9FLAO|nr:hypothetical protein [Mesonia aestuariivivens]MBW2962830.1 hypothetical protein [Mesonia aestuariivivens]